MQNYDEALKRAKNKEEIVDVLVRKSNVLLIFNENKKALLETDKAIEIDMTDPYARINKSIALKRLGKVDDAIKLVAETLPLIKSKYHLACAYAVIGNKEKMMENLKDAIKEDKYRVLRSAMIDPDFADYKEDSEFQHLLEEAAQRSSTN